VRSWLRYTYDGHLYRTRVTSDYSSDWAAMAHSADDARQRGTSTLLLNPKDPTDVVVDPGYSFSFFLWPLIAGAVGIVLLGVGLGLSSAVNPTPRRAGGSRTTSRRVPVVFAGAIVVVLAGTALMTPAGSFRRPGGWTAIDARIDSADIIEQTNRGRHGPYYTLYTPRLWIAYELGGKTYHRPVLTGAAWTTDEASVRQRVTDARNSSATRVFVNPSDPYEVTLAQTTSSHVQLSAVAAGFCVVLIAIAYYWSRSRRRVAI
jgi:hypothetical protein